MQFANPIVLALLPLAAGLFWVFRPKATRAPAAFISFPPLAFFRLDAGRGARWRAIPPVLRASALALMILALARPRSAGDATNLPVHGRNIICMLDVSSSMSSVDAAPDSRLEVASAALARFVEHRHGDFIGLVVFANGAFTQVPLTPDRDVLLDMLSQVGNGMLPDGTAIGTGLAMGEEHLKDLPRGSGVIVLFTDGGNNTGSPDPIKAAEIARALAIRVYTIGVIPSLSTREEDVLQRIASITGGRFYRATDPAALAGIMDAIDRVEKTQRYLPEVLMYREYYVFLLIPATVLLLLELVLRIAWLRRLP
ncbi:MAG: VWA domain-containing protein [Gemmatimonadota bacterium]|nr:VWA domain-containing protein [Gemmatimonadota bacterium]